MGTPMTAQIRVLHILKVPSSYFHLDASKPEPAQVQTGVVRTNCMDNLDRTNVGQSAIAKWMLTRQLRALGILHDTDTIDRYEDFMKDFRESMSVLIMILHTYSAHTQCGLSMPT